MLKKFVLFVFALLALLLLCFFAPNVRKKEKTTFLLVPQNTTLSSITDSLKKKDALFSPMSFYYFTRFSGYDKKIQSGRYALTPGLSNLFLLNKLVKGRQEPIRITFNNIRTKEQLCARITDQLMLDSLSLHQALSDEKMLEPYGVNNETSVSIFLPDTYEVFWDISATELLDKMYRAYTAFWTKERIEKAQQVALSSTEVIILASIVEEESNLASEKPTIAGLYLNRLQRNMMLQADPTIKFALGDFTIKRIWSKHIEATKQSPYNTYVNKGLPPGPIRIPEKQSIDAVLHYQKHDYYYMCAKGPGEIGHHFTNTYRTHINNANRYRKEMNQLGIQ